MTRFSIIVPTIGRSNEVALLLESLKSQPTRDLEVIIVDQNNNPGFLTPVIDPYRDSLNIIHHQATGKGASYGRNIGISLAGGEILLFPDDDCEFTKGLLGKIDHYFKLNLDIDGICIISRDKHDGVTMGLIKKDNAVISRGNILSTVIEAGIIVKKSSLNGITFDERMGVGSTLTGFWSDEGPDFILRLIEKGKKFNFIPTLYFYHPNPTKTYTPKTATRSYQYGLGKGYFLKKHGFPLTSLLYFCAIYMVGMALGAIRLNYWMIRYFQKGLQGRIRGYFS